MTPTIPTATMIGTEKQITWANDIRSRELAALDQRITECKAAFAPAAAQYPAQAAKMMQRMDDFRTTEADQAEATYWINTIRTIGDPRHRLNDLMTQWATELQTEIAAL